MKKHSGFTIIEIVITVLVASIVLALGVPSFRELMANNRMTTSTNALITALNLTRSEAIKRNARVQICSSSKPGNGNWGCRPDRSWADGWVVFYDEDDDGTPGGDNAEELIRVSEGLGDSVKVAATADRLVYTATGEADAIVSFRLCDGREGPEKGRTININPTGRVTIESIPGCSL